MLGPYSINMLSIENHTTKEFCLISQDTSSTSDAAYKCYLYITQNILITLKSKIPVAAHIQTKQEQSVYVSVRLQQSCVTVVSLHTFSVE